MVVMIKLYIPVLFLLAVSCAGNKTTPLNPQLAIKDIQVTGRSADKPNTFCEAFSLTKAQAELFFKKSQLMNIRTMHDNYEYLPCYVKGMASVRHAKCTWEIRAGGTADVDCDNGANYILGCNKCEEILRD